MSWAIAPGGVILRQGPATALPCRLIRSFFPGIQRDSCGPCRERGDSGVVAPESPLLPHDYLSSTLAPAFSSCALTLAASSLLTPSLTFLGAPSTRSLASFRPRASTV